MIIIVDESGSVNYFCCAVLLIYSFMINRSAYTFVVKKICTPQYLLVCIYDQFIVHTKFSMPSDSNMDAHRIYDLTLVQMCG